MPEIPPITPYATPEGIRHLVPLENYEQLKRQLDNAIEVSRDRLLAAQSAEAESGQLRADNTELLERLRERTESHLAASTRDVQTIQRQAVELSKWQALAEMLANAHKFIATELDVGCAPLGCLADRSRTVLAAYDAAKKGDLSASNKLSMFTPCEACEGPLVCSDLGNCYLKSPPFAKSGNPCKTCGGSKMTHGWYPTYNDPDNSGMHPEAEPCPDCQSGNLPDPLDEVAKRMEAAAFGELLHIFGRAESIGGWNAGIEAVRARLIQAAKGGQP